jgi:hypothetical protein
MTKWTYERVPLRRAARRYQEGGEVDSYDPLAASAGIAPAGTPTIDQIDWGQPSWAQQAQEQSQKDQEAFAREGVPGVLRDTEGTQDLAGGFSDAGFAGTIKAFHGSPHNFERFDTSKIGTGEGAQVYGHGLYFAENPAVAEDYKQSLSRTGPWEWEGKPLRRGDTEADVPSHVWHALGWLEGNQRPGESVAELIHRRIRDLSDHAEFMRRSSNPADRSAAGMYDSAVETLRRLDASKLKAPTGKTYEVNIAADPEHFLDWDKPLGEQSQHVRDALFNSGLVKNDIGQPGAAIAKYSSLDNALAHGAPETAQALREAGIPGIKYLDQHSRWATDMKLGDVAPPTHNYVVFDDKLIDIIKKYGLAGLIAGGAAHFQMTPTDAKAEGFKRGGAAKADDDLTPEEWASVRRGWLELVEETAHQGRTHYEMPPVRGMPPPGSFRIPRDVFEALGQGDIKLGAATIHAMLGVEDFPERPDLIHPHAVRVLGGGNINTGRKVLERFVARVRRQSRDGVVLEHDGLQHDDGNHGWSVRR